MTNGIGTGTKNLSVNVPIGEWAALHAGANSRGLSLGQYLKDLILIGAEKTDPATATQIRNARRQYYAGVLLAMFLFTGVDAEARTRPQMARRPLVRREAA